ncbi:hypothetical protein PYW08_001283 [Mythimna loreyi]|uniref:Uncharacterized protein n=1 Tax=Mythimna loreyi TaxID=667449 RepID=A0ACC2R233_9NEOP|nr:hypothetical protein PYW08_001283 [Mythimna loreyi]
MAPSEPPVDTCPCPKFCPLPTCPYHEDLSKMNTIEVTIDKSFSKMSPDIMPNVASEDSPCDCPKTRPLPTCHYHVTVSKININADITPIVWVLGGPGCGKGTQCAKIAAKYGYTHLSTGDILRAEVARGGDMAKTVAAIMERGELVPTEHVLSLLLDEMKVKAAGTKGFLVDGYPREKSQGMAFETAIAPATAILYFEVSDKTLLDRMRMRAKSSDRFDDKETTIQLRLKTFHQHNQYVMEQYAHKITKINAEGDENSVFASVVQVMDPIAASFGAAQARK